MFEIGQVVDFRHNLNDFDVDTVAFPWLAEDIRYYKIMALIGDGHRAKTYRAQVVDAQGNERNAGWPEIAIKVPKLDGRRDLSTEMLQRMSVMVRNEAVQIKHVGRRLKGEKYATTIIDIELGFDDDLTTLRTAQPFLSNARKLIEWLVDRHWRPDLDEHDAHTWTGLTRLDRWCQTALMIAVALESIHSQRVVHADVHPGNIMIANQNPAYRTSGAKTDPDYAIFIDFEGSFLSEPQGETKRQKNHWYRAPERDIPLYVLTEQADVYSFGKVLMYLATGQDNDNLLIGTDVKGHERRAAIQQKLKHYNETLLSSDPAVLDIIARCTNYDSAARPKMSDVVKELRRVEERLTSTAKPHQTITYADVHDRLVSIDKSLEYWLQQSDDEYDRTQDVFLRLVNSKLEELHELTKSVANKSGAQVEIDGSRDKLIDNMVVLFETLNKGDSWTAFTTPDVWVDSALGLDGRYLSATVRAVKTGASVRRFLGVSVEELGEEWSLSFAAALNDVKDEPALHLLGQALSARVAEYKRDAIEPSPEVTPVTFKQYRQRFRLVIDALATSVERFKVPCCDIRADEAELDDITGMFVGLVPVTSRIGIRAKRIDNPVSMIQLNREPVDQWLLVMTDIRGRVVSEFEATRRPQLLGFRVYRSVFGFPRDRHTCFSRMLRKDTVNVGHCLRKLLACMPG